MVKLLLWTLKDKSRIDIHNSNTHMEKCSYMQVKSNQTLKMGKYKKKAWYLIFGLLCLKNSKNLGIMMFKGRSKMSLSRISAESSQIFWRAPNAPWRHKEDMRHIEAQTTEIVSDQPGTLRSSCRQRSAGTVLNFILGFFWWSRNLAMRNSGRCLMWPQLIN